jgi:hypothetical protein
LSLARAVLRRHASSDRALSAWLSC